MTVEEEQVVPLVQEERSECSAVGMRSVVSISMLLDSGTLEFAEQVRTLTWRVVRIEQISQPLRLVPLRPSVLHL